MPLPEPSHCSHQFVSLQGPFGASIVSHPTPSEPGPGKTHLPGGPQSEGGPGASRPWPEAGREAGAVLWSVLQSMGRGGHWTMTGHANQHIDWGWGTVAGAQLPGPIFPNVSVLAPQGLWEQKPEIHTCIIAGGCFLI